MAHELELDHVIAKLDQAVDAKDPQLALYGKIAKAVFILGQPEGAVQPWIFTRRLELTEASRLAVSAYFDPPTQSQLETLVLIQLSGQSLITAEGISLPLSLDHPVEGATYIGGGITREQFKLPESQGGGLSALARGFMPTSPDSDTIQEVATTMSTALLGGGYVLD
jgi:hypothetical protein